jgi:choline dehydrogenase-like flavoprotein
VRRADAVVIGTGAGGAVAAARLAASGYDVVMLEEGGYYAASDFTASEAHLTEQLYAEGALRSTDDLSVSMVQGSSVGGSTTVNWMIMLRTPAYVLEQWARESGVHGMSPAEMAPVFARIEQEVHARDVPLDAHSPNNRLILDGAAKLGWRATTASINATGCIRCGHCGVGCWHDAKQSTSRTFVPTALAAGATLYADAQVMRIELRERDGGQGTPPLKRVHATVRGPDCVPRTITIDAPIVVSAGGAIGTPVLLQRSGLGGGGVGSWLRLHPTSAVFGRYDRPIGVSTGISLSSMSDEFIRWNNTDYGFWLQCPPMLPSFSAVALPGFGATHADLMRHLGQLGVFIALTRDGADTTTSSGRVSVDRRGRTSIRYRLTQDDALRVRASLMAAARLHLANGASEVGTLHTAPVRMRREADLAQLDQVSLAPNDMGLFSAHVNGTCRMGTDPRTSGATPDGERHGVRGLYISDGSLLPTALGVNPQETIMAVTSVLAERMATRHAGLTRG